MAIASRWRPAAGAALLLAASVLYLQTHTTRFGDVLFLVVTCGAAIAATVGACHAPRAARPVPQLIAAGLVFSALGDLVYFAYELAGSEPELSFADIPWFVSYGALSVGLLIAVVRSRAAQRTIDLEALFDVIAVAAATLLVLWELEVEPLLAGGDVSLFARVVWAGYPMADAVLLALVLRAMLGRGTRRVVGLGFGAGVVFWLAADLGYLIQASASDYSPMLDVFWMIGPWLIAAGAWHHASPSTAASATEVDEIETPGMSGLVLATAPIVVPIAMNLRNYFNGSMESPIPELLAGVTLIVLAFIRATRILRAERRSRAEARSLRCYYQRLAANSADAMIVMDATGRIKNNSPQLAALVGHPGEETAGSGTLGLVVKDDIPALAATFAQCLEEPGRVFDAELRVRHGGGDEIWLSARLVNLLGDPDVRGIVANIHDISARKAAEAELLHQAFHDSLTGIPNRALLRDRLEHAHQRNARTALDPAVLYVDLDGFKTVNDTLGHELGDELLCQVAHRLRSVVRTGDTVARLGGDEFALLIEASTNPVEEAGLVADRCLEVLSEPFDLDGTIVTIGASIGIAVGSASETSSLILRNADIAMYHAKTSGKGRWAVYDPAMGADVLERMAIESELGDAVAKDQLRLVYQPVIELDSQRIVGFEALLRWHHPRLGVVPPDKFIPIAEETGSILEIGAWVLRTACEMGARWQRHYGGDVPITMAVNLSARQLASDDLVVEVAEAMARSGLEPGTLVLEMTETSLIGDPAMASTRLQELHRLGIKLAIDDFGTGYSSLSYLRQFPVDILKIDRSFVSTITDPASVPPIVRALLGLGRTLELDIVAEGVEEDAQRDGLRDENCMFAQGYLFARPLDPIDAEMLLAKESLEISG